MVHLPTISNTAVSTGPGRSGHLGVERKQADGQMTLSFTRSERNFPTSCAAFSAPDSLLHEACLVVFAHFLVPDYRALQKGGEVNFQRPPEFLMTFLGVSVTCGAFYSRVCLGAGDSPPFGL